MMVSLDSRRGWSFRFRVTAALLALGLAWLALPDSSNAQQTTPAPNQVPGQPPQSVADLIHAAGVIPSPTASFDATTPPIVAPGPAAEDTPFSPDFDIEVRIISVEDQNLWSWVNEQLPGALAIQTSPLPGVEPRATTGDKAFSLEQSTESVVSATQIRRPAPTMTARLTDQQVSKLIQSCKGDTRTNILQAPTVAIEPGKTAVVDDTAMRPFVVGLESLPNGALQPQVQVIAEGLKMRLLAEWNDDEIVLKGDLVRSTLTDVKVVEFPIAFPNPNEAAPAIQIPEQRIDMAHVAARLSEETNTALIAPHWPDTTERIIRKGFWAGPKVEKVPRQMMFLLTARRAKTKPAIQAAIPTTPQQQTVVIDR